MLVGVAAAQDQHLGDVHSSVRNLLNISKAINSELDAQDGMLNELKTKMDETHDGIEKTDQRTQDHLKSKGGRCCIQ